MNIPSGFRFYTPDDPLAPRTRWALERIFKLAPAAIETLLGDPDRRVLLRVADDETLAGFVVFKDYKQVLLAPDNAFIARDDKELLGAPGLKVYSFEQIWYRDGDFDMARIVRETLPAMSSVLEQESARHALLGLLPLGEATQPLRDLLLELGFHANPNMYCDYRFSLALVPPVGDDVPASPPGFDLRTFEQPPDPAEMARTFNRVFAGGEQAVDADMMAAIWKMRTFARDLSLWVARDGRVAGFIWIFRPDPLTAKLNLLGTDPDFRGRGIVLSCTPMFMRACQRAGIATLTFTIQSENREPAKIAAALGAVEYQRRQTYIRVV
ncbi:MAG: hypothetical protein JXR83_02465 [Deltaproteobacteria bacterium]|nr:hypothetical protein [Deltaproteobacteria bacterium]